MVKSSHDRNFLSLDTKATEVQMKNKFFADDLEQVKSVRLVTSGPGAICEPDILSPVSKYDTADLRFKKTRPRTGNPGSFRCFVSNPPLSHNLISSFNLSTDRQHQKS